MTDFEFVNWLAETAKVIAVPLQVFYSSPPEPCTLVRFSICKTSDIIGEACAALEQPAVREAMQQLISGQGSAGKGSRL
jgi:aspartate/methionine/tyrosine aminotransferase